MTVIEKAAGRAAHDVIVTVLKTAKPVVAKPTASGEVLVVTGDKMVPVTVRAKSVNVASEARVQSVRPVLNKTHDPSQSVFDQVASIVPN